MHFSARANETIVDGKYKQSEHIVQKKSGSDPIRRRWGTLRTSVLAFFSSPLLLLFRSI